MSGPNGLNAQTLADLGPESELEHAVNQLLEGISPGNSTELEDCRSAECPGKTFPSNICVFNWTAFAIFEMIPMLIDKGRIWSVYKHK